MKEKIAIIGAGVIGLTTALEAQKLGFKEITIYSDKLPLETTSAKAGAVFEPYRPGAMSDEEMRRFVRIGLERYGQIINTFSERETGIRSHNLYSASTGVLNPEEIPFLPAMPHWQLLFSPNVPGGYTSAILFESVPFIDPTIALPWLSREFVRQGGQIEAPYRKIIDLGNFIENTPENIIFNCTGLGARELCGDDNLIPMRGQIAVVSYKPKWDWSILGDDGYYVFPRMNETILGGTTEENIWEETTTEEAIVRIIEKAKRILPGLTEKDLIRAYAGLRPYRVSGVRIEFQKAGSKIHIINVGHGGSGWTFCWGSAEKAMQSLAASLTTRTG